MRQLDEILAQELGCDKNAIADNLFPLTMGFNEHLRTMFVSAIWRAMQKSADEAIEDWKTQNLFPLQTPQQFPLDSNILHPTHTIPSNTACKCKRQYESSAVRLCDGNCKW